MVAISSYGMGNIRIEGRAPGNILIPANSEKELRNSARIYCVEEENTLLDSILSPVHRHDWRDRNDT